MPGKPLDLCTAIERGFAIKRGQQRAKFFELFAEATLWVAADEDISAIPEGIELPLGEVRLLSRINDHGSAFLLAFSSEAHGAGFRAGAHPLLAVSGHYLISSFVDLPFRGVIVNPGDGPGATVTRHELLALASGRDPQAQAERIVGDDFDESDVRRTAVPIPDEWSRQLAAVLTVMSGVAAAYVIDLRLGPVMEPRLMLVFEPDSESDPARVIATIRENLSNPFEVLTTEEPQLLSLCRRYGRRIY